MNQPVSEKIDDFIRGQRDCKDGKEHKAGQSEQYDSGYRCQYELEQINTERSYRNDARTTAKA